MLDVSRLDAGHLALERLLHCPDVDFLTAPSSYGFRPVGTGCSAFMSLTEAIKLHGKLWFNENDYRTHLVPQKKGVFDYVDLKNLDESVAVQKRELAHTICLGTGMWWFDMGGGWYDTPEFMAGMWSARRAFGSTGRPLRRSQWSSTRKACAAAKAAARWRDFCCTTSATSSIASARRSTSCC